MICEACQASKTEFTKQASSTINSYSKINSASIGNKSIMQCLCKEKQCAYTLWCHRYKGCSTFKNIFELQKWHWRFSLAESLMNMVTLSENVPLQLEYHQLFYVLGVGTKQVSVEQSVVHRSPSLQSLFTIKYLWHKSFFKKIENSKHNEICLFHCVKALFCQP